MSTAERMTIKDRPKRVVGYAPWWNKSKILKADLSGLTHLNLSFLRWLNKGGEGQPDRFEWDFGDGEGARAGLSDSGVREMIDAAHAAGVKILLSFGGNAGHDIKSMPLNDETHRRYMANVLFEVVDHYGFDGVDIDIETPYTQYWECFEDFTVILRSGCDARGIELTIAVSPWFSGCIKDQGRILSMYDFINMMSYDNQNNQDGTSAGIAFCDHAPVWLAYQMLDYYTALGISADKLTVGVPFYYYNYGSTEPGANNWESASGWSDVISGRSNIVIDKLPNETEAEAMWRTNQTKSYIGATEAGGICIWELGHDVDCAGVAQDSMLRMCRDTIDGAPEAKPVMPTEEQKKYAPVSDDGFIDTAYQPITRENASPDFPASESRAVISPEMWLGAKKGQTARLTANAAVTWSVRPVDGASPAKEEIVSVDESGLVTALAAGSAVVDAYVGDRRVGSVLVGVAKE